VGEDRKMRRSLIVLAAAGVAGVAAAPASAASGCSVPATQTWHSCLSAGHRAVEGTDNVLLTRTTPILVIRLSACPDQVISRKVTVRTRGGDKIASKRVSGKCKKGVIRYKVKLQPNVELRVNTVIQSFWTHLPDEDRAPKVKLKLEV
jgi:hypothetical protein